MPRLSFHSLAAGAFVALAVGVAAQPAAAHHPAAGTSAASDAARGLVQRDLVHSTDPRCRGLLMSSRSGVCTHGPDPAPSGRDVREPRSTAELRQAAGLSPVPSIVNTTPGVTTPPSNGTGAIVCSGDGVSGKRVEVIYLRPADKTDRFASIKDALGQYVIRADRQLNASAAESGSSRHWRFVTDPDPAGIAPCVLRITKVEVGSADDDTFGASINALKAQGYNRADRKYLIMGESDVYCGIGTIYGDDQPGQANINNGSYAQYARSDAGCWNYAEAHELMHNLGGVQPGAPNATPGWHCTDESDEMCYVDAGGVVMRNVCSGRDGSLFDCNHDDYFHAGTPAATNYLATHWNTATSAFLINPGFVPDTAPPAAPSGLSATAGTSSITLSWTANTEPDLAGYRVLRNGVQVASLGKVTSYVDSGLTAGSSYSYVVRAVDTSDNVSGDSATATATVAGVKMTTEQVSGSFKRGASTSASYVRVVQAGALRGVASGSAKGKPATIMLIMKDAQGSVLASRSGTSIDVQATATAAGAHSWTISGASGVNYSLTMTYPST